jgi:GntR family transcriptional regulator/MocR family aminotransferase
MLTLDNRLKEPLYLQVYRQIKEMICQGDLGQDYKLPSTRMLARTLSVGRNTVETAYLQLCSEGYVESKTGSGFYVNKLENLSNNPKSSPAISTSKSQLIEKDHRYNFQYGKLNNNDFPYKLWRKCINSILATPEAALMTAYNDKQGEIDLRFEIMKYLNQSRGVTCVPAQIVICAGTQQCLMLLSQLFREFSLEIAFEEPAYDGAREVFVNSGYNILPIQVKNDGLDLRQLETSKAKIAYLTPSHQFPSGALMPITKRHKLVNWAIQNNGIIIEDDYDSELRYNFRPVPAIQSLDKTGQVIYLGTFSKTLAPALRLSYLVLPLPWLAVFKHKFSNYNNSVPWLEQKALAQFMQNGQWERHLRKFSLIQKRKHDKMLETLHLLFGNRVHIHGANAGLHILLEFVDKDETTLINQADEQGIKVYPVSKYWFSPKNYTNNMILLGYSSLTEQEIVDGLTLLKSAWFYEETRGRT